jgi:epsilon-lactone hydrolase
MPSIQSRLFNFTLRNRHILRFHLKRETWDWNTSIPGFREECEKGAQKSGLPEGIEVTPVTIDGLPAGLKSEWVKPAAGRNNAVLFYTHGGGYVSGSCSDHRSFVAKFVKGSGIPALLYEYRLAPEHPYPAAIEDTLAAYRWLLAEGVSASNIIIVGESAGGGLCLATLLALRDQGIPLPSGAVALSPWTDLKMTGESYHTKVKACICPIDMNKVCAKYYVGDNDPCLPWISPLYGDLHGLPPLCIYVGDDETMRDDSIRFAEKARLSGVEVTLKVAQGMVHCYPLFAPLIPEATQAMQEICAFINTQLSKELEQAALVN